MGLSMKNLLLLFLACFLLTSSHGLQAMDPQKTPWQTYLDTRPSLNSTSFLTPATPEERAAEKEKRYLLNLIREDYDQFMVIVSQATPEELKRFLIYAQASEVEVLRFKGLDYYAKIIQALESKLPHTTTKTAWQAYVSTRTQVLKRLPKESVLTKRVNKAEKTEIKPMGSISESDALYNLVHMTDAEFRNMVSAATGEERQKFLEYLQDNQQAWTEDLGEDGYQGKIHILQTTPAYSSTTSRFSLSRVRNIFVSAATVLGLYAGYKWFIKKSEAQQGRDILINNTGKVLYLSHDNQASIPIGAKTVYSLPQTGALFIKLSDAADAPTLFQILLDQYQEERADKYLNITIHPASWYRQWRSKTPIYYSVTWKAKQAPL